MPQVNRILVPIDLHENAEPVVAWAALLARSLHSGLTLLHVNESLEPIKHRPVTPEPLLGSAEDVEAWRETYQQSAHAEFARLTTRYCADVTVATDVLEGRAHAVILEYLDKHPHDLLVMGTHGRPWYQRVVLGSTAEVVLRAAPCSALIVRNTAESLTPPRLKTLLLPTDFSVSGVASEAWALQLAAEKEIILLHAIENPLLDVYDPDKAEFDIRRLMEESREHPPRSAQPFWDHAHHVARLRLAVLRQQLLGVRAQVELSVREGPAAEAILQTAENRNVDLIIMSTHGRSGVRRLLLGGVTEKVIRSAPCPVLAVRGG
jgi:nucleotide-binding universal stress UspA family protein